MYADAETGLYYNGHRYYDPRIGRYISSDPIGLAGGLNTYSYVGGNPLRYVDPYGLDALDSIRGWWNDSVAGFQSESASDFAKRALESMPVDGALFSAIGRIGQLGKTEQCLANTAKAANSAADQLAINRAAGAAFEQAVGANLERSGLTVGQQITVETQSGMRTRLDFLTQDPLTGKIGCIECKASPTAPLTPSQTLAIPEIGESGGTIVGAGKPGFPGGMQIPPTTVQIIRGP